jgi:Cu/Ag efflux pump CusA
VNSLAFILGMVPLAVATRAGAEMRQSLATAVIFGMLGVTLFGLLFTPIFYSVARQPSGNASSLSRHWQHLNRAMWKVWHADPTSFKR